MAMMDIGRAPKGHFVVYVGIEEMRYMVPLFYLDCPSFKNLLDKAADEYGYNSNSRIVLSCDSGTFSRVMASGEKWELKEVLSRNCRQHTDENVEISIRFCASGVTRTCLLQFSRFIL
ncbi:hypothetical protein MLD38_028384 [Melastoma candidum]|uniref:Uncharacterized protein n=1 Tax=Melastoma candidum TaxID=119954 RepID=A0ACB9N599_9MYRT|nr:hypothetical protein MLD38_028384 [Melastoma candidum]